MKTMSTRITRQRIRTRVAAAFRRAANGVGTAAAFERTKRFFRAGGWKWVQALA